MFCRKCGVELRLNAKFCAKCGTPVKKPPVAAAKPETPAAPAKSATSARPVIHVPPTTPVTPAAPEAKAEAPAKLIINMPEAKSSSSNGQFDEWFTEAGDL